jgi:hypothetical protein
MTMKTISKKQTGVKVTTTIKAGGFNSPNHSRRVRAIWVKSGIKAGGFNSPNHNRRVGTLSVKSGIKAGEGILTSNHNRRLA